MKFKFSLRWELSFLKISLLCFGLQLNFVHIGTVPISNYSGYRTDTYYIEAKVMRPLSTSARSPWYTGRFETSSEEGRGRDKIFFGPDYSFKIRSGIGNRRPSSSSSIVFPTNPPQRQQIDSRRPMSTRMGNLRRPEVEQNTEDGKAFQDSPKSTVVFNDKDSSEKEAFTPNAIIQNNDKSKEDLEALFGDFYNWIETSSKSSNEPYKNNESPGERQAQKSTDKLLLGSLSSSKPKKFDPLENEDLATKTNFVTGNEDNVPVEEDSLDGLDVTEQSLLHALNDKYCPEGFKRVPSGECKPKIKV